ncbi:MAG: hypothetical protein WCA64_07580 [Gallionella sp.]
MSEHEAKTGVSGNSPKIKWIVITLLSLLAVIIAMNLPRGFSDDMSQIGKGRIAVVLVRDKNAAESLQLMNVVDDIRSQYAGRVEFLLTDYDTPEGRAFMAAHNAARISLVLFDPSGKEVKVLAAPQTPASLQQEIVAINGASK